MKQKVIGGVSGKVFGMLGDLMIKMKYGVITPEHLRRFLNKEDPFLEPILSLDVVKDIYTDLGIECIFPEVEIFPEGNVWPVVVPKDMTPAKAYAIAKKLFPCWSYWEDGSPWDEEEIRNMEEAFAGEIAEKTTIRFFKADINANDRWNEDFAFIETVNIKEIITITERILLEVVYFKFTGEHLDTERSTVTVCAGSHDSNNIVPNASWNMFKDRFQVNQSHIFGNTKYRVAIP